MSSWLLKVLIAEYAVMAAVFLWDNDIWRCMYFFGATIISLSVLYMQ